jgi:hypothetical protein
MNDADEEMLAPLEGLHVGLLSIPELEALSRCVRRGTYRRDYDGVAGFLGLAKVRRVTDREADAP